MFTIRFENHSGGYDVYSCANYQVRDMGSEDRVQVCMYDSREVPGTLREIGPIAEYAVAYVTNGVGKTIDTIRHYQRPMP